MTKYPLTNISDVYAYMGSLRRARDVYGDDNVTVTTVRYPFCHHTLHELGTRFYVNIVSTYGIALCPHDYALHTFTVMDPVPVSTDPCTCPWVPEHMWTTHYGAVEPGSQREYDPRCPEHGDVAAA